MIHRRRRYSRRRNSQSIPDLNPAAEGNIKISPEPESIPLPNVAEDEERGGGGILHNLSFLGIKRLLGSITLEEILLVGLIFILLDEGVEDELLIVALIYILVAGRE